MSNNMDLLGTQGETILMSVSAADDHAGISQEVVWWEVTLGLPFCPLPLHLCGFENLRVFSAPGILASQYCFDGARVLRSDNWMYRLSPTGRVKPSGCLTLLRFYGKRKLQRPCIHRVKEFQVMRGSRV